MEKPIDNDRIFTINDRKNYFIIRYQDNSGNFQENIVQFQDLTTKCPTKDLWEYKSDIPIVLSPELQKKLNKMKSNSSCGIAEEPMFEPYPDNEFESNLSFKIGSKLFFKTYKETFGYRDGGMASAYVRCIVSGFTPK